MQTAQSEIYLPGPLHPDLFDGESPMMLPVSEPPRLFEVRVSFVRSEMDSLTVHVAAESDSDAMEAAQKLAEEGADENESDFETETVTELAEGPTREQLEDWASRKEVAA